MAKPDEMEIIIPTLLYLRPHLKKENIKQGFINQTQEGYRMIFIGDEKLAFALAGFRTRNVFYTEKTLYIEDLVTHPDHRRKGYAEQLLDWLKTYAKEHHHDYISLDSGFQRKDAYRLYLNKGLEIEAMHFGRKTMAL